jgi:hypothetical protein
MDLRNAAENLFADCERDELVGFCDQLGVEYLPQHNGKHLRVKLLEQLGVLTEVIAAHTQEKTALAEAPDYDGGDLTMEQLAAINLRPQGKWQGRRRMIVLHREADHTTAFPQFFAWEDLHCYIPWGVEAPIPFPIWNILFSTTQGKRLIRKRRVDEDGRIFYEEHWVNSQRFMFTDLGDDPVTAHLPRDIQEQFRWMWHKTEGFDGYSLRQFQDIARRLKIHVPRDQTWQLHDYKNKIAGLLGANKDDLSVPLARAAKKQPKVKEAA